MLALSSKPVSPCTGMSASERGTHSVPFQRKLKPCARYVVIQTQLRGEGYGSSLSELSERDSERLRSLTATNG
jgi:hypothetical protein